MGISEQDHIARIEENYGHQRQEWKFEKLGWVFMSLFLLAGILGFFGSGVFSRRTLERDRIQILYYMFSRAQAPSVLHIEAASQGDTLRVSVSRPFIEAVELEAIDPEPESSLLAGDRIVYTFLSSGKAASAGVSFRFRGEKFGSLPVRIKVGNEEDIPFSIFFIP